MTDPSRYHLLRIAGFLTLAIAAVVAILAFQRARQEREAREDVSARVEATMNHIEAEARRIEEESKR